MGFHLKFHGQIRRQLSSSPYDQITIVLPDFRLLLIIARSLLLAMAILAFPCLQSAIRSTDSAVVDQQWVVANDGFFIQDLKNEGLLKSGDRVLLLCKSRQQISRDELEIDQIYEFDDERQRSISNGTYDFVFADGFRSAEFIDRIVKIRGVVAVRLGADVFRIPPNYKIVHIRRFESTVMAMMKIGLSPTNRRLFAVRSDDNREGLPVSPSTGLYATWVRWIEGGEPSNGLYGTEVSEEEHVKIKI